MALSKIKLVNKKAKHERARKARQEQMRRQERFAKKKMRDQAKSVNAKREERRSNASQYVNQLAKDL